MKPTRSSIRTPLLAAVAATAAGALGLSLMASPAEAARGKSPVNKHARVLVSHASGVVVLNARTLKPVRSFATTERPSLAAAGNGRHAFVTEQAAGRVRIIDLRRRASWERGQLSATKPGHVVSHHGVTAVFDDGTGNIQIVKDRRLGKANLKARVVAPYPAHHGVAIPLEDGGLVTSVPGAAASQRIGLAQTNSAGVPTQVFDKCPKIHGEAEAAHEVLAFGCEDGIAVHREGSFTKIPDPDSDPAGFSSALAGTESSPILAGTYTATSIALANTRTLTSKRVEIGVPYSNIVRTARGAVVLLGTDGLLRVIDPATGTTLRTKAVLPAWTKPTSYLDARPTLTTVRNVVYVTNPATNQVLAVDSLRMRVQRSRTLAVSPFAATAAGPGAGHGH